MRSDSRYSARTAPLHPGDVLVAFTDGLTDAQNFAGERFRRQRLEQTVCDALQDRPGAGAQDVLEHIFWSLRQFAGLSPRTDDQTVVVARVLPGPAAT